MLMVKRKMFENERVIDIKEEGKKQWMRYMNKMR